MKKLKIAGIGELLWDILPDGEKLGGAPVNFVYHVTSLGADGLAVSTIGNDKRGKKALSTLEENGISTAGISKTDHFPTGFVTAHIDTNGIASYSFPKNTAWDHLHVNNYAKTSAGNLNCVCFGTLAQRGKKSRKAIHSFLANCPDNTLKVFDLNLRQNFYSREIIDSSLNSSNVLKLNDDELLVLARMFDLIGNENEKLAAILQYYHLKLAILTRGVKGSLLLTPTQSSDHPGIPSDIVDTVGAGDSFTAATVIGFLQQDELDMINTRANTVAAFVCGHTGAMIKVPNSLEIFQTITSHCTDSD